MLWCLGVRQTWQLPRGAEERGALPPTFCDMKRQETVVGRGEGEGGQEAWMISKELSGARAGAI